MQHHQLRSIQTGKILFEAYAATLKDCAEQAIDRGINLSFADFRRADLSCAMLDGGRFDGADFTDANLSGANLSEASLRGAHFKNTALYNACLCLSDLSGCNFQGAGFGATDIHGALLKRAIFSTLSCFTLDFFGAGNMEGCAFIDAHGITTPFSQPPVVVNGLGPSPLIFMGGTIRSGHERLFPVLDQSIQGRVIRSA
jgi:uncharacterized protein YjbI with pentapeptide repeats